MIKLGDIERKFNKATEVMLGWAGAVGKKANQIFGQGQLSKNNL